MDRLFTLINRINSVLFLLLLIGAGLLLAWSAYQSSQWHARDAVAVAPAEGGRHKPLMLGFAQVEHIAGSDTQMLRLTSEGESAGFSSGGGADETHNLLFLGRADEPARWLFQAHKNLILRAEQFPEESCRDQGKGPTKALYVEYVAADSDGDGRLSRRDHASVALTRPDGRGLAVLLPEVKRVLSTYMAGEDHLMVIYQRDTSVRRARLALASLTLASDQEILRELGQP